MVCFMVHLKQVRLKKKYNKSSQNTSPKMINPDYITSVHHVICDQ